MKEYRKPTLALIVFDAKDVLASSASAFNIGWLGFDPIPEDNSSVN